jgi:hypothetical protein
MPHENLAAANRHAYNLFNASVTLLGVANANILSLTTVKGTNTTTSMEGMIRNITCHENLVRLREQIADQMAAAADAGLLTDALIAAANTVAGVRTVFVTTNGATADTTFPTFAWAR